MTGQLVSPQIQRSNNGQMGARSLDDMLIDVHLLFLPRELHPVEKKKLRPIKANSLRATFRNQGQILRQLYIGRKDQFPAVPGGRRSVPQGLEFLLHRQAPFFNLPIFITRLFGRMDNEQTGIAVENDRGAGFTFFQRVMQPDHCGNIQGTGHDGRVRGGAAHFRHKTQRHLPIQQSRVGGRQIVG